MLSYVYDTRGVIAQWVSDMIPHCHHRAFGPNIAIGVLDEGYNVIAGFVYHNFEPEAGIIEISTAALPGKNWYTRETMARMFQYPFLTCNCQMVILRLQASDERLQRQLAMLGFALIKVPRFFGRNADGVIATLTYEDWCENKFNKRFHHHDAALPLAAE